MKFLDIFVPVDLNRFEAQVRAKVRSYFLFIFFVICLATFLMKFFQAYAEADGTQIFMCALTAFFYLLLVLVIWICVSALIRFTPVVYRKIAGTLKKEEQENAIPSQQAKDTPLPESPFRGEKAESVELFTVDYLKTHHHRWEWGCLYLVLLNNLLIEDNKTMFHKFISIKYPDLQLGQLRNFQIAVQKIEESGQGADPSVEDEIERITSELKKFA